MSADQLLYPMDHSSSQSEWYDFDNFFEFPSDSSNSTSVNSISPKDLDLTYTDVDGLDWTTGAQLCSQAPLPDLVNYDTPFEEYIEQALGASDLNVDPNNFLQFPPPSPREDLMGSTFNPTWPSDMRNNADPLYSTIRHMVESQVAVDYRGSSKKEKRREAGIAVHLQRLHDSSIMPEADRLNVSSPRSSSDPIRGSASLDISCQSPASSDLIVKSPTPGGMELVLDLNMNTPTNLPKKQKPRSRAQKENYIKVRKHGACEKHRKQHKRCNCLDIAASRIDMNGASLLTTNRRIESIQQPCLQVHGPEHGHILPSAPRQSNVSPNIQPARLRVVDQNYLDRLVHLDQRHVHPGTSLQSPNEDYGRCSPSVPGHARSANTGQPRPLVHQPDTTLCRSAPQGPLPRQVSNRPRPSSLVTRLSSPGAAGAHGVSSVVNSDATEGYPTTTRRPDLTGERWAIGKQPTGADKSTRRIRSSPGRTVLADAVGISSLVNSIGSTVHVVVGVLSALLPPSRTSWAEAFFSRVVVFSSRHFLLARKGMGLS